MSLPDGQGVMAGENVIIRPTGPGVAFVQLDDLKTPEQLDASAPRHSSFTRPAPEIIRRGLRSPACRRIRNSSRRSPGACARPWAVTKIRLARDAPRRHRKLQDQIRPDFPTVKILEAHPGKVVSKEQLEAIGLVAAPEPESVKRSRNQAQKDGSRPVPPDRPRPGRTMPYPSPVPPAAFRQWS